MTPYLNLGCGGRFHPDWINIDVSSNDSHIIQHDLSRGIPLPDASCRVVYHAAVLEHFRQPDVLAFLQECLRVLKPGGIIRIGVPDLEQLCRLYLQKLETAQSGDETAAHDYDWIMLEIFDQMAREQSGGGMLTWLRQDPLPNETFIYARIGEEGRELVRTLRTHQTLAVRQPRLSIQRLRALPGMAKRGLLAWLLSEKDRQALAIGRFRLGGEVHQWMYDRYSLARLLRTAGFTNPVPQDATTSQIPDWSQFHLDTRPDGTVIKPDLFFMEAIKS
jgi:predicted SAM-dependent methyltransferase